jgi:hypothetical protein
MTRPATLTLGIGVLLLALMSATLVPTSQAQALPDGWRTFEGSWSAVGHRQTVPTEQGRAAAVVQLSGAVVLTDPAGPSAGFLGEAIAFDDGGNLSTGRAVWTDARGDRLFSTLRGDPLHTGRRIVGTITGGTGRYAGFTGDYALTWQYIVSADDNVVQGRTVDLRGRFHAGESRR